MFGKGGEFQPLGVFTDKEVEHVDAKTLSNDDLADSNGKITADFPVFVRSKVLAKNVDDNKLGWAFNSVLEGYLMNLKTTTGAYIYRDEMNTGKLLGFPYRVSNQITTDTTGLTELAFGNWADLLVGEQMGLETYTTLDGSWVDEEGTQHNAFEENLAATRALMYVDIAARHTMTGDVGVLYRDEGWVFRGYIGGLANDYTAPRRYLEVKFTAGYVLPKDATEDEPSDLPEDIVAIVWGIAEQEFSILRNGAQGLAAFSISDVSWTFDKEPRASWMETLAHYMRW